MRLITALVAAGVAIVAVAAPAAQQPKASSAAAQDADKALEAIADADIDRLFEDEKYALHVLANVETVRRSSHYSGEFKPAIDRLYVIALIGSGRTKEALAQATALTRAAPGDPELHYLAFGLAVDDRSDRALDELELAGRSIRSEADRARFIELLGSDPVHEFRQRFYIAQDKVRLARSAQALLNLGWPGPHKDGLTDRLKMEAAGGTPGERRCRGR